MFQTFDAPNDASAGTANTRSVRALMQRANDVTIEAYKAGLKTLREGMPQGELVREPVPDAVDPAPKVVVKPATRPAKPSPAKKSPATEEFMVQLGAFSNGGNAKALQKKLKSNPE